MFRKRKRPGCNEDWGASLLLSGPVLQPDNRLQRGLLKDGYTKSYQAFGIREEAAGVKKSNPAEHRLRLLAASHDRKTGEKTWQ